MIKCIECKKKPTTALTRHEDYCHHTHYAINTLDSIQDLKDIFEDGKADNLNWVVASTSGVHGTYTTLKDIEKTLSTPAVDRLKDEYYPDEITVLVILPRMVRLIYGNIKIKNIEELNWMRKLIKSSLTEIKKTQIENISK